MCRATLSAIGCMRIFLMKKKKRQQCCLSDALTDTGWQKLIGSPKLQIIFHKRATKYRALLLKWPKKIRDPMSLGHPLSGVSFRCVCTQLLLCEKNNFSFVWIVESPRERLKTFEKGQKKRESERFSGDKISQKTAPYSMSTVSNDERENRRKSALSYINIYTYLYINIHRYIYICSLPSPHLTLVIWHSKFSLQHTATHCNTRFSLGRERILLSRREVGGWGRDPKKCTGSIWGMGSSTI